MTTEITKGYWQWCNSCQSDRTCKLCDGCRRGETDEKPPSGWPGVIIRDSGDNNEMEKK